MTEEIKLPKIPRPDSKPPTNESEIILPPPVTEPTDLEKTGIGGAVVTKEEAPSAPPKPELTHGDPRFELRLTETKANVGAIPITWCVDRDWLFKNSNSDQYVLLCSAPPESGGHVAEWRGWAKLSDMMAYVTFYRPGKNRILARVTPTRDGVNEWMERSRDGSSWMGRAMEFPEGYYSDLEKKNCKYLLTRGLLTRGWIGHNRLWNYIDIDMPPGCFAKEPSNIEKIWVNFFFKNKAVDQCEFRRRRMLAYTVQPLIFLVVALFWAVVISCVQILNLMIGKWTVWEDFKAFSIDKRVDFLKVEKFGPLDWMFVPVPGITTAACVLWRITHLWKWMLIIPALLLVIPIVIGFLCLGIALFDWIYRSIVKRSPRIRAAHAKAREVERLAIQKAELEALDLLLCNSGKRIYKLGDLPKNKRTIKLRFQNIKSAVCKPFAR